MENNIIEQVPKPTISGEIDKSKPLNTQAKEYVNFVATEKAVQDQQLVNELTDKKKQELKSNAEANLKKEQAENKKADVEIQKANFDSYEGVATYAGIQKPLPNKMQKILFTTLSFFQMILLLIISIPTSIINILADSINSIVEKLSNIAKSARVLVLSLITLGGIGGVIYLVYFIINRV
jgi:Fe2+ transport system protein B